MTPPMLTRQSEEETDTEQGQWTTIVHKKAKQKSKRATTRQSRNTAETRQSRNTAETRITSTLSKAAEIRQLIRAMEHTLKTGERLKHMSTRQKEVHAQALETAKQHASRDYIEIGRIATRLYGAEVQRTKDRHRYTKSIMEYIQTFPAQVHLNSRTKPTTSEADQAVYGNRRPGVEETKTVEPEEETEIPTPKTTNNTSNQVTPHQQDNEQLEDDSTEEEEGSTGDETEYTMQSQPDTTTGQGDATSVNTEEDGMQLTQLMDSNSDHSATARIRETFAATARVLDHVLATEEDQDTTPPTDQTPVSTPPKNTAIPEGDSRDDDMEAIAMDVTFLQDKVRQKTEEVRELKEMVAEMRMQQATNQRLQAEMQRQLESLQAIQQQQQETISNMEGANVQGRISALDVEQGVMHNEMEAIEAQVSIVATQQQDMEAVMVTHRDLQALVRTQLQEQARKVARIIYTTTRDQCREACEAIQSATVQRLRQDSDQLHDSILTKLQRAGDEVYNTITEASDEVQEKNIQILDAAVATYETEISTARQAEITHFSKELQHHTEKQSIPELRRQVLKTQRRLDQQAEQTQRQLNDKGQELQDRIIDTVWRRLETKRLGEKPQTERELHTRMEQLKNQVHEEIRHQITMLRQEVAADQTSSTMKRDIVDEISEQQGQRINALRSWAVQEHDHLRKMVQQELRGRGTEKVYEDQQVTKDKERQEQQEWMDRWAEANREEIKDHIRHFQQEIAALRESIQTTQNKPTEKPNKPTEDPNAQPMFRGHPINLSSGVSTPTGRETEQTTNTRSTERPYVDKAQQLANRGVMKDTQKFKKEEMVFDLPMTDSLPLQRTMEGNYKMLHNSAVAYGFPLLPFHALEAHSYTTLPPEARQTYDEETLQLVSTTIYLKLNVVIPPINEQLRVILRQHADSQDGYTALFAIMQHTCDHLRLIRHPWGPTWARGETIHEYYSSLQSKIKNEHRQGRRYTPLEVAAEFLQQARNQPMYVLPASQMLTEIRGVALRQIPLPSHLEAANILATYQNITPILPPSQDGDNHPAMGKIHQMRFDPNGKAEEPPIHAMQQKSMGATTGEQKKQPQRARNAVQCPACNKFGHTVDHQICHFAAQTVKAQEWIKEHPADAQNNAQAYQLSNAPRTVKQMEMQFQELFTETMTEEDKQDMRDKMVSTFTHGVTQGDTGN